MDGLDFRPESESRSTIIASSGPFQIERIKSIGEKDFHPLIHISKSLAEEYGTRAILTVNTIQKYFNRIESLPFIARFQDKIIGYIIGVPLEVLSLEPWARLDMNFGKQKSINIKKKQEQSRKTVQKTSKRNLNAA